ncbi:MAG: PriCT-2 domain-containing protein, partial [Bacteroidales bacterium]|nr:PriCT-2 domain-containing protein [Bacteroidales bacterium]
MERDVRELLKFIDPAACDYFKWLSVGMALFNVSPGSDMLALWDTWSAKDRGTARDGSPRYKASGPYSCAEKWKTFRSDPGGFSMGTLVQYAKEGGYDAKTFPGRRDAALTENAVINETPAVKRPGLSPCEQLAKYIETLFEASDFVGYVTESAYVSQGRWVPDRGVYTRTAGEILGDLKAHPEDLTKAVGRWHEECGAWIRVNALNGQGVRNADVKSFRYALVESDTEPVERQREVYERLRLPIACLVSSGGKSLHAIVKIDAETNAEYGRRVDYLY